MFEVNLVPDVKAEMLKTQRIRNVVILVCIVIVAIAGGVLAILGGIKAGQDITMSSQDETIKVLSNKINEFEDLNSLLTIQGQLDGLEQIGDKKVLLSRIFSVISVLLPSNGDEISLSELNVDLKNSTLRFDAQANANVEPLIDYRVLDAFKKSMPMMRYDYGRYVDEDGNEIPTVCIVEADNSGVTFSENGDIYAIWTKGVKGCNPAEEGDEEEAEVVQILESDVNAAVYAADSVKIWRTPQLADWSQRGYMEDGGEISGVPHFESECTTYSKVGDRWTSNNVCELIPKGIEITDSTNARDSGGSLVLRFSATITYNPEVLLAKNKHMLTVAPSGHSNVTDSYMQIEGMFKKRADDCAEDDTACLDSTNEKGQSDGKED